MTVLVYDMHTKLLFQFVCYGHLKAYLRIPLALSLWGSSWMLLPFVYSLLHLLLSSSTCMLFVQGGAFARNGGSWV